MKLRHNGFACVGLINPKYDVNVGSVLRAAGCFQISGIFYTGERYQHAGTDTCKTHRHIPLIHTPDIATCFPYGCVPVAVDILPDAIPLPEYTHPKSAFYIFGPEDGTLDDSIIEACRDKIYIPTTGCLNLAAAVNIVLYDRSSKNSLKKGLPDAC